MASVIALSKIYSLNDPRICQTTVKGDLIVPKSDRIMTRSRAKNSEHSDFLQQCARIDRIPDPDQYTIVTAQLKIIKVLIEELLSASGAQTAATAAAAAEYADDEGDDDGWEDEPGVLDLGLGATKAELMAYGEGSSSSLMRRRDDETQAYLTSFFIRAASENIANFNELYTALTPEEKEKLTELAKEAQSGR